MDVDIRKMIQTLNKSHLRPYGLFLFLRCAVLFGGVIHITKNALLVSGKETCASSLRVRIPSK